MKPSDFLKGKGETGDCVAGDEYDRGATEWFKLKQINELNKEFISRKEVIEKIELFFNAHIKNHKEISKDKKQMLSVGDVEKRICRLLSRYKDILKKEMEGEK